MHVAGMCIYVLHVALVIKPALEESQGARHLAQVKRDELALLEHVMILCERADAAVTADRCVMPLSAPCTGEQRSTGAARVCAQVLLQGGQRSHGSQVCPRETNLAVFEVHLIWTF